MLCSLDAGKQFNISTAIFIQNLLFAIGLTPGGSSTVQYTFTHKKHTEQHNDTEYTEYYIHNNKNT
jgi:hypothetical protein